MPTHTHTHTVQTHMALNVLTVELMDFACFSYLQLDLQLQDEAGGDISSFITNGEWDLLGKQWPRMAVNHLSCVSIVSIRISYSIIEFSQQY